MFEEQYNSLIMMFGNPEDGALATTEYVIEECAELIQAIQHAKRARKNANPIEEMAHVYTMLDALCVFWDITDDEINKYKQELIDRYVNKPNAGTYRDFLLE